MEDTASWTCIGSRRRWLLLVLIVTPTIAATWIMQDLLLARAGVVLNVLLLLLFAMLFAWVAVGFCSAFAGIVATLRRFDRFSLTPNPGTALKLPETARTAILFPVYNEDPQRVTEAIRIVWRALEELGVQRNFDIFMLSDSTNPDVWTREEEAWFNLCHDEGATTGLYYRHRTLNRKGKSGNIADFCRRWGANYPYMVVFDADSLITGRTLVRLVQAMEANPNTGIIQTAPKSINSRTLIARIQQFSNHLYGPIFAAGLHYWQLGDAQYWGHNAIIRVDAFMRHCHLPALPGHAPLGGNILSHDFVEAALMRRAGYGVWLAYDMEGSYEENPPSLIDELIRDRRWCQGNLQHSQLLFTKGFFPTHRALFINGIMSYGSALLWFLFLVVSSCQAVLELLIVPVYFPAGYSLFPDWPKFLSYRALGLFGATAVLIFLPKLVTLTMIAAKNARGFGGAAAMAASALLETIFSTLLAPVRMLYHSFFVVTTMFGFTVRWNTQNRDDSGATWLQALRFHWWGTLLGLIWGFLLYRINPGFFWWMSPIVAGLVLAIPLSVWTSRPSIGGFLMHHGLFLTPADTDPPPEIVALNWKMKERRAPDLAFHAPRTEGFIRTVVVPKQFTLHMAFLRKQAKTGGHPETEGMIGKALTQGPHSLDARERRLILSSPGCLSELHRRVWLLDSEPAREWGIG